MVPCDTVPVDTEVKHETCSGSTLDGTESDISRSWTEQSLCSTRWNQFSGQNSYLAQMEAYSAPFIQGSSTPRRHSQSVLVATHACFEFEIYGTHFMGQLHALDRHND
jgi:hypothetical protein